MKSCLSLLFQETVGHFIIQQKVGHSKGTGQKEWVTNEGTMNVATKHIDLSKCLLELTSASATIIYKALSCPFEKNQ